MSNSSFRQRKPVLALTRDQLGLLERFPFDEADINADGRLSIAEFAKVWGAYNSKK